jgi:hypothetical protein
MKSSRIAWLAAVAVLGGCTTSPHIAPTLAVTSDAPADDSTGSVTPDAGDPTDDASEEESPSPSSTPAPKPTPKPTKTVKSTWDLGDGRFPAYLTKIDGARAGVTVDVIQWLSGDAADKAAIEDGVIEAGDSVPNDYYVRNVNPKLRTLPVAAKAPITVNVLAAMAGESDDSSADVKRTWAQFTAYADDDLGNLVFWLTVKAGVVTKLEEQYQP